MNTDCQWFVKTVDGNEYGPAAQATLITWAQDSRIEPSSLISSDRKTWTPAPLMRELGMEWLVETESGRFFGPFHRNVVESLRSRGMLLPSSRTYRLTAEQPSDADKAKKLSEALLQTRKDLTAAQAKADALSKEIAEERRQRTAVAEELNQGKKQNTELADALNQLQDQYRTLNEERMCLQAELKSAQDELRNVQAELKEAQSNLTSALNKVKDERSRAEELEKKLDKAKRDGQKSGGLFHGLFGGSSGDLSALEQAVRRELAAAKYQQSVRRGPQSAAPRSPDVIDV